jgi:spore maturation protein CgeB
VTDLAKRYPAFIVFGDPGWRQSLPASQLGTAKYYDALPDVYRRARITIDINRMVIRNGFTQRPFDTLAGGGFVLTGAKPVVSEFFSIAGPNQSIAVFRSEKELFAGVDYYLSHEQQRRAVAERGRATVMAAHTYDHRIAAMFRQVSGELAGPGAGGRINV